MESGILLYRCLITLFSSFDLRPGMRELTIAYQMNLIEHLHMPHARLAYQWTLLGASENKRIIEHIIIIYYLHPSFTRESNDFGAG